MPRMLSFLLCVLLVPISGTAQDADSSKKKLSVDEIIASSTFALKSLSSAQWLDGGRKFSYIEADSVTRVRNVYTYSVADGKRELVMDGSLLVPKPGEAPMRIGSYQWSPDASSILVTGTLPARRTKSGGNFGIFSLSSKTFRLLTDTTAEQAIVQFAPDGTMLGFVRSNNLFMIDLESGRETQLTFDGSDEIINGKFDWVYEEEFSIINGWEWSPDSKRIAFWRLDQTNVPAFPIVHYPEDDAHASVTMMKYPKAGDPNSIVRIGVVTVETGAISWIDIGANTDIYVPRIMWTHDPEILAVQRLNRGQDTLDLMLANIVEGTIRTVLQETDSAWVEVQDNLRFLEKSDQFLWTSWRDGFMHIYLYDNDGTLVRQLTRGEWDVENIVAVNEKRKLTYFTGTEASPMERHLYSIRLDGTGLRRLTKEQGWHSINMAPGELVYIDTYSNITTPTSISLHANDGKRIARLAENRLDVLKEYALGKQEFFAFRTADGQQLHGMILRPPDFSPDKKYPVLMHTYAVGGQDVTNRWGGTGYLWHQLLAQHGYITVRVDNRGTDGRGRIFRQAGYRRLGIPETEDLMEAARYLGSLPFVDSTRIGIYGSSGGGYTTCMALTYGADVFKTGIAISAVTNHRFYDTIWAERFMDRPQDNPDGYRETSPITHAAKMKGNLLIVHGTVDDNVHWQNSIVFINELIRQNKQVQTMFYPGRAHGIYGNNASRHLYTMMLNFILEKL